MMHKTLIAFLAALALPAMAQWAYRVPCELQSRDLPASLKTLTWQQGTTPLIQLDLLNNGKPQAVDTNAQAVLIFGPAANSSYFVATTNTVATGTHYQIQLPTVGTNSAGSAWWYTVYFEVNGLRYWTGNGEVYIEATTSTADGLEWQQLTTSGQVAAEAVLRVTGDLAGSNYAYTVSTAAQSAAQSYAGTLMQTGTAARATSADYATVAGTATNATYVLGPEAWITMSGTTGILYWVTLDGVGYVVTGTLDPDWTGVYRESGDYDPPRYYSSDGATMIWWWESGSSWAIVDSDLGIGYEGWSDSDTGSTNAVTEGVYVPYPNATGDATVTRVTNLPQTNSSPIQTAADLDAALAGYSTNGHGHVIADVTGLQDALDTIPDEAEIESIAEAAASAAVATIPGPGVTVLSGVTPTITGATIYYDFAATNAYVLSVESNAPRYGYSVLISGTNAITLGAGISWEGNAAITPALTNRVVVVPEGNTNWNAIGRAY